MNIREQFNTQWHGIEDVVLSEAQRQIKFHGRVNAEQLTVCLKEQTGKWQRGILVQGLFYKELMEQDTPQALLFAETSTMLKFTEPMHNRISSTLWLHVVWFVVSVIVALFLHIQPEISYIKQTFYPVLVFVILNSISIPYKNKCKRKDAEAILSDLKGQMKDMKELLDVYLKKY